jgi:hypothetical protein
MKGNAPMRPARNTAKTLATVLGFSLFVTLAAGSDSCDHDHTRDIPDPDPVVVGQGNAMTWATTSSADLAAKIQELESARANAQREISRLESLREQFPAQAGKISGLISGWQQVVIELSSALTAVEPIVSDAYVAHHVDGADRDTELRRVYDRWKPKADRAISLAQAQQSRAGTVGEAEADTP